MSKKVTIKDFSKGDGPLTSIENEDQIPLPPPFDKLDEEPRIDALKDGVKEKVVCLDDTVILNIKKPATKARKGINPFTGEEAVFKAKPARTMVKVQPLKALKDMAE